MPAEAATIQVAPGEAIPVPKDFPLTWDDPHDQRLQWVLDGVHYPNPMAPLEFELMTAFYEKGREKAMAQIGVPVSFRVRRINTYLYRATMMAGTPPDGVARMMNRVRKFAPGLVEAVESKAISGLTAKYWPAVDPIIGELDSYWTETLLPEIRRYLRTWEQFDLEGASMPDLLTHLDRTISWGERIGEIHSLIFGPYVLALSQFDELYHELFSANGTGSSDAFASYRLLQGFDTLILTGDRMLWDLSRRALTMPAVQRVLEETAAADVIPALEESAAGQVFLDELRSFLAEHGFRGAMFSAIGEASWIEDPTPIIKNLKDYIGQPDRDGEAELAAEAAERDRLVSDARARLSGYPAPVIQEFERLLKAAQTAIVLHSDHGFWIDYRAMYEVRRVLLELGRRLVASGAIEEREDVLCLTLAELTSTARDGAKRRMQSTVTDRKKEMERFSAVRPPAMLGTMPLMAMPTGEPLVRAIAKAEGGVVQAGSGSEVGLLRGSAGSPGSARGPAKVVRSLADAHKLEHGDILVAETTAPPWTPLFATVAAVVTDTGGVLSHCAVVAREYHIPAVVGAAGATETVQDGQMIEVDGGAGIVRILQA